MAADDIHNVTVNNRSIPGQPLCFAILSAVACLLVVVRIYTRFWVKQAPGWDDYTIIPALIFALGWFATELGQIYDAGSGRHTYTFTPRQQVLEYRWNIASNCLGGTSRFLSRTSICLFLLRVVQRTRSWRAYLYVSMTLNACLWVATVIVYSSACAPGGKGQSSRVRCLDTSVQDIVVKIILAFNALVDVMISLFPFLMLKGSQLDIRSKATFCFLIGCCALTAGCSIARVITVDYKSPDANWDLVPLTYWSCAEQLGLIIVACLPAAHQLYSHHRDHHTLSRIGDSPSATSIRLATLTTKSTGRATSTASTDRLNHAPDAGIRKTTEVDLELHDEYGRDRPAGANLKFGLDTAHTAP